MCTSHWGESLKCPEIPATEPLPSFELRFAAMLSGWVCGGGFILRALQFLSSQIRAPRHKKSVSKGDGWGKWALDWLVWIQKVTLPGGKFTTSRSWLSQGAAVPKASAKP